MISVIGPDGADPSFFQILLEAVAGQAAAVTFMTAFTTMSALVRAEGAEKLAERVDYGVATGSFLGLFIALAIVLERLA